MKEHDSSAVIKWITQNILQTASISLLLFQGAKK